MYFQARAATEVDFDNRIGFIHENPMKQLPTQRVYLLMSIGISALFPTVCIWSIAATGFATHFVEVLFTFIIVSTVVGSILGSCAYRYAISYQRLSTLMITGFAVGFGVGLIVQAFVREALSDFGIIVVSTGTGESLPLRDPMWLLVLLGIHVMTYALVSLLWGFTWLYMVSLLQQRQQYH